MLLPTPQHVGTNFDHLVGRAARFGIGLAHVPSARLFNTPASIAGFLILNQTFHAIAHAVSSDISIHAITGSPPGEFANAAERALGWCSRTICGHQNHHRRWNMNILMIIEALNRSPATLPRFSGENNRCRFVSRLSTSPPILTTN